ncbi:MAG: septum formation protein Maf [Planctomycetaceae bacterium]|nr:septum formation protein Maf [Planctomycetaceae bacterium]
MLILASGSRYRHELLSRLVSDFQTVSPDVDEDAVKAENLPPVALAQTLARMKTEAVARLHPQATVIGSDQLVNLNGRVLGKPGTAEAAVEQLLEMAGQAHELVTAVTVLGNETTSDLISITRLQMRRLSRSEAERYVARDNPLDCAGSYRIESAGISLFDRIDCDDFTSIIGLPLMRLARDLRQRGFDCP